MKSLTKQDIPRIATEALQHHLDKPGGILYSSHETIRPGSVYFLGLNPGGCGGPKLSERIENLLSQEGNVYLDEAWQNEAALYESGQAPLQKRAVWLLENIDFEPRNVLSSNLIFIQSKDESGVSFLQDANDCWPVHEALLSIVRPRLILAYGNSKFSPYSYIHSIYGGQQCYAPSGHGNWSLKGFNAKIAGSDVFVAGIPHLSRYDPIGKQQVLNWIKNKGQA